MCIRDRYQDGSTWVYECYVAEGFQGSYIPCEYLLPGDVYKRQAPDGEGITGYNYFYLNYSPIMRLKEEEYTDREGNLRKRRQRILEFPRFWDYDYYRCV